MNYVLAGRTIGQVLGRSAGTAGNGLLTGLVAYWKLDEASGNAIDAHSNGLTLTQAGTVGNGAGQVYATARGSYSTTQYFSRASEAALQAGNIDFAFAAWYYRTANTGTAAVIVGKDNNVVAGQREYIIYFGAGNQPLLQVHRTDTVAATAIWPSVPAINTWHLLCCWHDATNDQVAIQIDNGTPTIAATGGALQAASTAEFVIGNRQIAAYNAPFNGRIGPVAFWKNRTLSAADRAALWNGGAGLAYSAFS